MVLRRNSYTEKCYMNGKTKIIIVPHSQPEKLVRKCDDFCAVFVHAHARFVGLDYSVDGLLLRVAEAKYTVGSSTTA